MAFPTTAVIDNFDRADNTDLGANWSVFAAYSALRILSNAVRCASGADTGGEYWSAATFGPDVEVYYTLAGTKSTNQTWAMWARVTTPTGSYDAYETEVVVTAGTDEVYIYRFDDATPTQLGATITQEFNIGDSLGLEVIGTSITAYRKSGGSWASLGSRTDATYSGSGNLAMYHDDTGVDSGLDDVGGGTVVAGGPDPFVHERRVRNLLRKSRDYMRGKRRPV